SAHPASGASSSRSTGFEPGPERRRGREAGGTAPLGSDPALWVIWTHQAGSLRETALADLAAARPAFLPSRRSAPYRARLRSAANSSHERVLATCRGSSQARRAVHTPYFMSSR